MAKPFYSSYNEKAMLVAVIALLAINVLMLFFHFYAKWHFRLQRPRSQSVDSITEDPFPAIEDEETSGSLDPYLLAELPIFMYKAGESKNWLVCVVCLNALEDEEKCRILPKCRHCFHVGCVDKWLLSHSSCPLCRAPVGPVEHVLVVTREDIGGSSPRMSEAVGEDDYGEHQNSSVEIVVEIDPPDLVAISSSSSSSLCSLKRMLSRSRSESKVYPTSPVDS